MLSVIPDDDAARASASNILAEKSHSAFWKDVENLVEVSDELREDVSTIAFDLQDLRRWVHYKLAEIEKQKLDMLTMGAKVYIFNMLIFKRQVIHNHIQI